MKRLLSILILTLAMGTFADSTDIKDKYNSFYMKIPNALGYERQLPYNFFIGCDLYITMRVAYDTVFGFTFDEQNEFNLYLYRQFSFSYISVAPALEVIGNSSSDSYFCFSIKLNHKFKIKNTFEIVPSVSVLNIYSFNKRLNIVSNIYPTLRLGVIF